MDKHVKPTSCSKGGPHVWVTTPTSGLMKCSKCAKTKKVSTKGQPGKVDVPD